jgi:hypothetical protein
MQKLAQKESCIFVGRTADYALKDFDNVVNIFIHGDFEFRKQRAIEEHNISKEKK